MYIYNNVFRNCDGIKTIYIVISQALLPVLPDTSIHNWEDEFQQCIKIQSQ